MNCWFKGDLFIKFTNSCSAINKHILTQSPESLSQLPNLRSPLLLQFRMARHSELCAEPDTVSGATHWPRFFGT